MAAKLKSTIDIVFNVRYRSDTACDAEPNVAVGVRASPVVGESSLPLEPSGTNVYGTARCTRD